MPENESCSKNRTVNTCDYLIVTCENAKSYMEININYVILDLCLNLVVTFLILKRMSCEFNN